MCGIAGWVNYADDIKNSRTLLNSMIKLLKSRGPDDSGEWYSNHAILGHRRLIVVDPEGGAQPMQKSINSKKYTIVYNGEIYNTTELRNDLREKGYKFSGHCDTEVLLLSYINWGEDCLSKINGIFAFAVWDGERLFAARDRLGVKPFFYSCVSSGLIFGSEIKAVLEHPDVRPVIDLEGLAEIFAIGPARTPGHAVFKYIKELEPGFSLTYSKEGLKIRKYWDVVSCQHEDDFDTTVKRIRYLVIDSIKRQLSADVPVCTLLSGGLDSSAISAVAANYFMEQDIGKLTTLSVDYKDNKQFFKKSLFQPDPDSKWIGFVSDYIDSSHVNIELDSKNLAHSLLQATFAKDLPGMADVDSSLLLFCRQIKKHATVVLSGECADEIFGGYPWFYYDNLILDKFPWTKNMELRKKIMSDRVKKLIDVDAYSRFRLNETLKGMSVLETDTEEETRKRQLFYLNLKWFMLTLLERKDRMSMATGLEVRVPFCDHRIVEYLWNVPWEFKNYKGREKGILRYALSGLLPKEILWRKKSPYPKTHHPEYEKAVKGMLLEILDNQESPINDLIDVKFANKICEDVDKINIPWFGQLMTGPQLIAYLIQINTWLTEYKIEFKF